MSATLSIKHVYGIDRNDRETWVLMLFTKHDETRFSMGAVSSQVLLENCLSTIQAGGRLHANGHHFVAIALQTLRQMNACSTAVGTTNGVG